MQQQGHLQANLQFTEFASNPVTLFVLHILPQGWPVFQQQWTQGGCAV